MVFQRICSGEVGERGVRVFLVRAGLDSKRDAPPNRERREGRPVWGCLYSGGIKQAPFHDAESLSKAFAFVAAPFIKRP